MTGDGEATAYIHDRRSVYSRPYLMRKTRMRIKFTDHTVESVILFGVA